MKTREIKFRAWTGKEMYYQDTQYLGSFVRRAVPKIIAGHGGDGYKEHESYLPNGGNIEEYLMQFTGLKDKNGKEIYEGDIYRSGNGRHWVVEHGTFTFVDPNQKSTIHGWYLQPLEDDLPPVPLTPSEFGEVIGNIYENSDLLTN